MGIFDKLKKSRDKAEAAEETKTKRYVRKYPKECSYIWKNYVPERGQADNLQGELLREIEKLRWEAQSNGNINWDEDFAYFCDFISNTLSEQSIFSEAEKEEAASIMNRLKSYGIYAKQANDGEIPYDDIDMYKIAYIEDDLYDIICDKIARLHMENRKPLPYEKNESIYR